MDSLSLKTAGFVSRLSVIGALHCRPALGADDLLTRTALSRVCGVVEGERYLVRVPVGGKAHPRIRGAFIELVPSALCEARQLIGRQHREASGTIGRNARPEPACAAVGVTILLEHADEVRTVGVVGAGRVDVQPRLDL